MKMLRKYLLIFFSIGVFILFFWLLLQPLTTSGYELNGPWQVVDGSGVTTEVTLPFLQPLAEGHDLILQTRFPYVEGDTLVIRRPSGNALRVSLNGERVYDLGDISNPTANIWNSVQSVPLQDRLHENNLLEIRISGISYDVGLSLTPYIANHVFAEQKIVLAKALYDDLMYVSMGAVGIVALILIVLSFARRPLYGAEFFLGMASLFALFYSLDFVFRYSTVSEHHFMLTKKMILISGYMAALSFVFGLEKLAKDQPRVGRILCAPTLLGVAVIGITWDMGLLVKIVPYVNIVLLGNITAVIIITFMHLRDRDVLLIPAVLLAMSLIQQLALTVLGLTLPFVMQYVMLISSLVFGISMILEYNHLYQENLALEHKANHDPLTGAFNRNVFSRLNPILHDVLILLDLDNLKQYNDRYGHPRGDNLLIQLTDTIKTNLRQNDLVIRYGGDEFILILNAASIEDAERIMERIEQQFTDGCEKDWLGFSYGISQIESSVDESLARADEKMYEMKKGKKIAPQPNDSGAIGLLPES